MTRARVAVPAAAAILTVNTSVPVSATNFHTIQAAVNASSSGDTINIAAGTYSETVTLPYHSLHLIGAGKDVVTWDGLGSYCIDWLRELLRLN